MKVILLKELAKRGGEGDVIEVARGYATNYLFKAGIAVEATKGNLTALEQKKANIEKREVERVANANEIAEKLEGAKIKVEAQVGDEGQLFGSVTAPQVADAIKAQTGIEVDKRRVELGRPIKQTGEHKVAVNIYRNINANVVVVVKGNKVEGDKDEDKAKVIDDAAAGLAGVDSEAEAALASSDDVEVVESVEVAQAAPEETSVAETDAIEGETSAEELPTDEA